jgi:hypothetical protein
MRARLPRRLGGRRLVRRRLQQPRLQRRRRRLAGSGDCAPGCPDAWLGDGTCDAPCDNADCNYDWGDC